MHLIRPTRLFVLGFVLVAGGCSTVSTFDRSQTTLEPDAYIAALSFDTTAVDDWPFDSAMVDIRNGPPLGLAGKDLGVTMIVFQMSRSTLALGELILSLEEDEGTRIYQSTRVGPKVMLQKGSVTYIGSLVVDDISLDEETGSPRALRLRIVDSWESDELAWKSVFAVFEEHDPTHRIVAGWGDSEEIDLRPIQALDSWKRPRSEPYPRYPSNLDPNRNVTIPRRSNSPPPRD